MNIELQKDGESYCAQPQGPGYTSPVGPPDRCIRQHGRRRRRNHWRRVPTGSFQCLDLRPDGLHHQGRHDQRRLHQEPARHPRWKMSRSRKVRSMPLSRGVKHVSLILTRNPGLSGPLHSSGGNHESQSSVGLLKATRKRSNQKRSGICWSGSDPEDEEYGHQLLGKGLVALEDAGQQAVRLTRTSNDRPGAREAAPAGRWQRGRRARRIHRGGEVPCGHMHCDRELAPAAPVELRSVGNHRRRRAGHPAWLGTGTNREGVALGTISTVVPLAVMGCSRTGCVSDEIRPMRHRCTMLKPEPHQKRERGGFDTTWSDLESFGLKYDRANCTSCRTAEGRCDRGRCGPPRGRMLWPAPAETAMA